jgi:ketosteroid isomerase-like protein
MTRSMKLLVASLSLSFLVAQVAMGQGHPAGQGHSGSVALVKRFYEEVGNGRKERKGEPSVLASNFRQSYLPAGARTGTPIDFSGHIAEASRAMPGLKFTVNDVVGEKDVVYAYWSASATRDGKPVKWSGISRFRVSGGKIVEMVVATDPGAFKNQPQKP